MIRGTVHLSRKGAVRTGHGRWHVRDRLHPQRRGARGASGDNARTRGRGAEVRRADAPVAPGDGNGVGQVRGFLHPGSGTVRGRPRGFRRTGLAPVDPAACPEREGKPARAREASLRETPPASPPRGASGVRDIILRLHGVEHTRGGAIGPTHRPGSGHVRPEPLPGQADRAAREAFMRKCGRTVRDAPPDGATVLPDAARPEWRSRPAHGRVLRGGGPAVRSTTGRRRPDPHGAPDPGTVEPAAGGGGRTCATTALRLPGNRSAPVPAAGRSTSCRTAPATVTRGRPCPSWSGRDAASGRASRRPTRRTRPHRAPVGGHAPPREA